MYTYCVNRFPPHAELRHIRDSQRNGSNTLKWLYNVGVLWGRDLFPKVESSSVLQSWTKSWTKLSHTHLAPLNFSLWELPATQKESLMVKGTPNKGNLSWSSVSSYSPDWISLSTFLASSMARSKRSSTSAVIWLLTSSIRPINARTTSSEVISRLRI